MSQRTLQRKLERANQRSRQISKLLVIIAAVVAIIVSTVVLVGYRSIRCAGYDLYIHILDFAPACASGNSEFDAQLGSGENAWNVAIYETELSLFMEGSNIFVLTGDESTVTCIAPEFANGYKALTVQAYIQNRWMQIAVSGNANLDCSSVKVRDGNLFLPNGWFIDF